ncbi:fibronectin type III-like domain-contianing protein [Actinomyces sp. zg296]|uniref:fibronectin type III-like domain-contianing protein n=1 Tax=Actinomyces sp. zg296 TaxID=2609289 RepID=UPI001F2D0258|nr:fibronectin type III-like domain-contianing protein [Actinomyces sp. zg296]
MSPGIPGPAGSAGSDGADDLAEQDRDALAQFEMVEGEVRAGRAGSLLFVRSPEVINALQRIAVGQSVTVSVDVANIGSRDGKEVVQFYIHQRHGTSTRPERELKAFTRVAIPAGRSRAVEFVLGPDELSYWSAVTRSRVQDATTIDVYVGGSSAAIAHTVLEVVR